MKSEMTDDLDVDAMLEAPFKKEVSACLRCCSVSCPRCWRRQAHSTEGSRSLLTPLNTIIIN
ncbi:hypothetical protein E2C01_032514 [Portunus trituberculatus]|uniref:Uncharacterized protein n=1 Tax=Portunus trituberculatus TaxID=210409 RepID=A0A5B7EZU1_PORTR|nr:hypothetical protein [Portunus trituberculatus]